MAKNRTSKSRSNQHRKVTISKGYQIADDLKSLPVINQTKIDIQPVVRQKYDPVKWRNALRVAESRIPRRVLLYDMYSEVMTDGHVIAVTGKRIDPITTAKWQFVDSEGNPVDEVNQLLDTLGFADLLTEIMNSRFWGYSMIECKIFKNLMGNLEMTAEQYDRKHMRPDTGIITYQQTGDEGFSIREGGFAFTVIEAGKPRDMGLLLSASLYAIFKKGGFSDYATFVEVFGQPILDAEWDGFDEEQRLKLLEALNAMGTSGKIVRPAGTKITALDLKGSTGTGDLHHKFINALNSEISKGLLGTTETTESSSSSGYAQSREHGKQDDVKHETDIDYVRRHLNSRFMITLWAFGLPVKGGRFIIPEAKQELTQKEQFDMFVQMYTELGMPVDYDFIYEFTGMPKPADFDKQMAEKKAAQAQETQISDENDDDENADTPPASKPKKDKKPGGVKLSGRAKLALKLADFFGWPRI